MLVQCNIADISLDEAPQNLENKLKDLYLFKNIFWAAYIWRAKEALVLGRFLGKL